MILLKQSINLPKQIMVNTITQYTTSSDPREIELLRYAKELSNYLKINFPECIILPTESNNKNSKNGMGKNPAYSHKHLSSEDLWKKWDQRLSRGVQEFKEGLLIVMRKDMIVIDVDDLQYAAQLEERFPNIIGTVMQQTSKGKHYFFRRSALCEELKIVDAARKLVDNNNELLPVDIKTVCSTGTGGVISIFPSQNKKWIAPFQTTNISTIPDDLVQYIVNHHKDYKNGEKTEKTKEKVQKLQVLSINSNEHIKKGPIKYDMDEVQNLVQLLNEQRSHYYTTWINVGWCLYNIDKDKLLPHWIEFSKMSSKFVNDTECTQLWEHMCGAKQKFTIASLHFWARQDNPKKYQQFVNNNLHPLIINCTCASNSIALIIARILKGRFVCPDPHTNIWYEFTGSLWASNRNRELRQVISNEICDHFKESIMKLKISENELKISQPDNDNDEAESMIDIIQKKIATLEKIIQKLCDHMPKKSIVDDLCDILYDSTFYSKLDANPNLIAFTNGVLELNTKIFRQSHPDDYVSISVKYDFIPEKNETIAHIVDSFWKSIHPNQEQREYMQKAIARQMYGDSCAERFHIHAGSQGGASNGKTSFFEVLGHALGDYIYKFGVEHLTAVKRQEAQKPSPEFAKWKGRRILYCTEPSQTDVLNSGILKDYSGNEIFNYRLLHSNFYDSFVPQFCMHIMCNEPPKVEGECQGIKRRIRKIDYESEFVDAPSDVDERSYKFLKNKQLINEFSKHEVKMEFMRLLIENYEQDFRFLEPEIVKNNSKMYLEENDSVLQFVNKYIVQGEPKDFFTMRYANDTFKMDKELFNGKLIKKERLEGILKSKCIEDKFIQGKKLKRVFMNYKIVFEDECCLYNDLSEDD